MSEKSNSEQPKALPAPEPEKKEEKKRIILNFSIDVEELYNNIPEQTTPENQKLWASQEEMSEEYREMCGMLEILTFFIARQCNEGPEVKDNTNKRMVLVRTIFGILMENLHITGYDCYGLLNEMLHDYYMKLSGSRHIMNAIFALQKRKEQEGVIKSKDYTS
jgi:hypothetical protein